MVNDRTSEGGCQEEKRRSAGARESQAPLATHVIRPFHVALARHHLEICVGSRTRDVKSDIRKSIRKIPSPVDLRFERYPALSITSLK